MTDYTACDHEFRDDDIYARTKYEITLRWLRGIPRPSHLANVGCGSGVFNQMAVDAGFVVTGYEPDPDAFRLAQDRLPPHDCRLEAKGLEAIPTSQPADVVVMHDVLEHIEDEQRAVNHLREIVTDHGHVVLSVPAMPSLFGLHDEELGHFRRYTRRKLRRALDPSFEIIRLRSFGAAFIPITAYYSRWRRTPYPVDRATGAGVSARVVHGLCGFESRVRLPIGTSLLCEVRPRPRS
jgi:SAM-dependent methyltransferase